MKRLLAFGGAALLSLWAQAGCGQSTPSTDNPSPFTDNQMMSRGPAAAPVTIYEFSDYQ